MPEEKSSTSSSARNRTSGRGRSPSQSRSSVEKQSSASPDVDVSSEPRVVRRRPASARVPAAKAEDTKNDATVDTEKSRTSRRRSSESAVSDPVDEVPEKSTKKRSTTSRSRSGTGNSGSSKRATGPKGTAEKKTEKTVDNTATKSPRRSRSTAKTDSSIADSSQESVVALSEALSKVQQAVDSLGDRLDRATQRARLGVFVDVPNVLYGAENLESQLDMGKLLEYLSDGRELVRATAYSPVSDDPSEPVERQRFVAPFVPHGYRIVTKPLKRFADGSIKGNFDVEMAIDMLTMAERLDVIACVSGDSDFARLVEVIQGRGVRVEVVAFAGSTSVEMRALADHYVDLGGIIDQVLQG